MHLFPERGPRPARRRVYEDWFASLPREKSQLFDSVVHRWESSYAMMSVALSDALTLRSRGEVVCARQQAVMARDLLARLADILIAACQTLTGGARHLYDVPPVEPLNTSFFRGSSAQNSASWNSLLHYVLFGSRFRFLHKIKMLSNAVSDISREFDQAVEEITAYSLPTDYSWEALDPLHYDLSTCLRELEVVFKSFLRALPAEHVSAITQAVNCDPRSHRDRTRLRPAPEPTLIRPTRR